PYLSWRVASTCVVIIGIPPFVGAARIGVPHACVGSNQGDGYLPWRQGIPIHCCSSQQPMATADGNRYRLCCQEEISRRNPERKKREEETRARENQARAAASCAGDNGPATRG